MPRGKPKGLPKTGGRQKGTPNKIPHPARQRAQAIVAKATAEGITPLEVMLKAMRAHYDEDRFDQAAAIAKDAAPYLHPRLAAIEHTGKDGGPIETKEVSDTVRARALMAFLARTKALEAK